MRLDDPMPVTDGPKLWKRRPLYDDKIVRDKCACGTYLRQELITETVPSDQWPGMFQTVVHPRTSCPECGHEDKGFDWDGAFTRYKRDRGDLPKALFIGTEPGECPTQVVTITVTSDPPADEPTVVEGK